MSKKKDRGWFVCAQWRDLVASHYQDDVAAAHALRTDPKVLARLRQQTPVARSTLLKLLRRLARLHSLGAPAETLIVDTRSR
jgi:hypothetical protein